MLPELTEILASCHTAEPFLRKNVVDGAYRSVHHYLDVQFRLFREDFMRPLRDGIRKLNEIATVAKKQRNANLNVKGIDSLNVYFNVLVVSSLLTENGNLDRDCIRNS